MHLLFRVLDVFVPSCSNVLSATPLWLRMRALYTHSSSVSSSFALRHFAILHIIHSDGLYSVIAARDDSICATFHGSRSALDGDLPCHTEPRWTIRNAEHFPRPCFGLDESVADAALTRAKIGVYGVSSICDNAISSRAAAALEGSL